MFLRPGMARTKGHSETGGPAGTIWRRPQSSKYRSSVRLSPGLRCNRAPVSYACRGTEPPASLCSRARRLATGPKSRFRANGGGSQASCAKARAMTGRPILTTSAMGTAEQRAIDGGTSVERLMERAGAALAEPKSDAAKWARSEWKGEVEQLGETTKGSLILIDALFGTGLKKGLETSLAQRLFQLARDAKIRIACDVPSGVDSDTGAELSAVPAFDMTVTF